MAENQADGRKAGAPDAVEGFPPGFWVDEGGALHVDVAAFLEASGYEATPENQAMIEASLRESFERLAPGAVQVTVLEGPLQ